MSEKPQVYIDMDGVVADFDQMISIEYGDSYDNSAERFWHSDCVEKELFRNMPPIPEGVEMVSRILDAGHPICFMTSTGGEAHHIDIAKQKLDWLHGHGLGFHPVAFCLNTSGKGLYAARGKVLIDDRVKVCLAWIRNGGAAHLFTREAATIIVSHFT